VKVLLVNKFHRQVGGAETVAFETKRLLEAAGHEVAEFAMEHEANMPSPWSPYFARRRDFVNGSRTRRTRDSLASIYSFDARRRLRKLIHEFEPNIAHLHNVYHQLTLSIIDELRAARVPAVMTVHDYKPVCPNYQLLTHDGVCRRCIGGAYHNAVIHRCVKGSLAGSAVAAAEAYLMRARRQYEKLGALVSPSRFLADILVEDGHPPERVRVIPNPVVTAAAPPAGSRAEREFIFAGRLVAEKGVRVLAAAAGLLTTHARIVVYGEGPLRGELERVAAAGARLEVRGFAARSVVERQLQTATALLLPSVCYENCPMAVLEAGAAGAAVIASRIGGIPELVCDGETGILVDPGDARQLAASIDALAVDGERAVRLGQAAYARVAERHAPDRYASSVVDLYRSIMWSATTTALAGASVG
jgi:glycosyltransferase involved in cell wall biosynthesis